MTTLLPTIDFRIDGGIRNTNKSLSDGLLRDDKNKTTDYYVEMGEMDKIQTQQGRTPKTAEYTNSTQSVDIDTKDFVGGVANIDSITNADNENDDICSVATVEGIHDYPGYYCICLVILIGDMSRGVMFPTMWPLVQSLDGTAVTLGYAVAAFSFGRSLVNPLFGYWSDTKGYSNTLQLSCTILLLGTFMYAQIQTVNRIWFLFLSQTVLGIGSGTLGVTRAFVADITDRRNRTKYMGWTNAVQYAGFTMTPAIGAMFIRIFDDNDYYGMFGIVRINKFTAPAYFMFLSVIATMIMLSLFFKNRFTIVATKKSKKQMIVEDYASTVLFCGLTLYDCCIIGCMLLNLSTRGSIACFETLGIAIAQDYFSLSADDAGMAIGLCGTFGVISLLCMGILEQRFSDVQIIAGGLVVLTIGVTIMIFGTDQQSNPLWQYLTSVLFVYSIGYPIANTAVLGMFSKIIGRRPQGELLGWFASAGSAARVMFPILSGYVARYSSIETLFQFVTSVLLASLVFVLLARKSLNYLSS